MSNYNLAASKPAFTLKAELDIASGTFYIWNQALFDFIDKVFGMAGKAIVTDTPFKLTPPHRDDLDGKSKPEVLLYARVGDFPTLNTPENRYLYLSDKGQAKFDRDTEKFEEKREKESMHDMNLVTVFKQTMTELSKQAVKADPRYYDYLKLDPLDCQSAWLYYQMIVATHKTGNLTTKVFRAQTYFQLAQMGMPLEEYHELIRSAANAFSHDFGSKDPYFAGYVRLEDIFSAIYLMMPAYPTTSATARSPISLTTP